MWQVNTNSSVTVERKMYCEPQLQQKQRATSKIIKTTRVIIIIFFFLSNWSVLLVLTHSVTWSCIIQYTIENRKYILYFQRNKKENIYINMILTHFVFSAPTLTKSYESNMISLWVRLCMSVCASALWTLKIGSTHENRFVSSLFIRSFFFTLKLYTILLIQSVTTIWINDA